MLTADEIVEQAFGRIGDVTDSYPTSRAPMYRRIGYRQRQLYAIAAQINPERYGACATANLSSGMADLSDVADPVPTPELVQEIVIEDPGTSRYAAGDRVAIVRADDPDAEVAPRALLRDKVVIGVGTDLDGVTSIKVYYPRLPDLFLLTDDAKEIELEAPYDTLLELDLVLWLLPKCTALDAASRTAAIAAFREEEKQLLAEYQAHVHNYAPVVSRFGWPAKLG